MWMSPTAAWNRMRSGPDHPHERDQRRFTGAETGERHRDDGGDLGEWPGRQPGFDPDAQADGEAEARRDGDERRLHRDRQAERSDRTKGPLPHGTDGRCYLGTSTTPRSACEPNGDDPNADHRETDEAGTHQQQAPEDDRGLYQPHTIIRREITDDRHSLHAHQIEFNHPITHQKLQFQAAVPPDMQRMKRFYAGFYS